MTILNETDEYNKIRQVVDDVRKQDYGDIEEFMYIKGGKGINYSYDTIDARAIDAGFELFCPHTKEEYDVARRYIISLGENCLGPLGIHHDSGIDGQNWGKSLRYVPLNSTNMAVHGVKVVDGSADWWACDLTTVTEPNGDWTKYAYLNLKFDALGKITWYNDASARYSYSDYLCVKRKVTI